MKFKEGDKVTGTEDNNYGVTNQDAVCEVIEILSDFEMEVKVLDTKEVESESAIGDIFIVEAKYFRRLKPKFV